MKYLGCSALLLVAMLTGCEATTPPPYEADKAPEDRTEYSGKDGLIQKMKDDNYLQRKQLMQQCDQARVDYAVAEQAGNQGEMLKQKAMINRNCME